MGRVRNSNQVPHRAGPLVQTNKKHKAGKHRTKGEIDKETKGRTNSIGSTASRAGKHHVKRAERKKQAAADRIQKIQAVLQRKRSHGGMRGAPISLALIPLSATSDPRIMRDHIVQHCHVFATVTGSTVNTTQLKISGGKNLSLVIPPTNDVWTVLDTLKLSDVALFVMPTLQPLSEVGTTLLQLAKDQGCPTKFIGASVEFTKTEEKSFLKSVSKLVPVDKIFPMVNPGQIGHLLRIITSAKISTPKQHDLRAGMLIEDSRLLHLDPTALSSLLPNLSGSEIDPPTEPTVFQVTGHIRKRPLNPHRPVHIAGHGNFQILRIDVTPIQDVTAVQRRPVTGDVTVPPSLDCTPPPRFLFDPNAIGPEDTAEDPGMEQMSVGTRDMDDVTEDVESDEEETPGKQFPVGTSEYQADWLADSDSEREKELMSDDEELESLKGTDDKDEADDDDDDMDWDEEQKEFQLAKAARAEAEFPDWIDTPQEVPAKDRFQRYRGLQSFKTSAWDVNENLPKEYSKLCQFQNYKHTYKMAVVKDPVDGPMFIPVGQRVTVTLRPLDPATRVNPVIGQSPPAALFSLFQHETKMSVMNIHLNLSSVVKNKESLMFQMGFYRFTAKPILSEVSPGNKHKMLRYGQANSSCMATIFAPILFPVASVLAFKTSEANLTHVGSGHVFSIDPTRLVIKRVLLSGYPFRVHGRKSTVRFMFFNRQDIEWFKPVELKTRYGRRGHIKEPLGTHGHMKCVFDGALKSQDTILMPLYKRVFPKWNYDTFVPSYALFDRYD